MSTHRLRHHLPHVTRLSAAVSIIIVAILAFIGGWQRRWIADDGLIVLRTVRNLMAGNGPVFNAGERVETNTSTLWQYLVWLVAEISRARLETVAIMLGLFFFVVAFPLAIGGTARLHRSSSLLLVPVGVLAYLALPPARDFATSGLEWGLAVFWLALLWWLLARWSTAEVVSTRLTAALAFTAGMSWLVRPELALYGGLAGLVMIFAAIAAKNFSTIGVILLAGLPLPVGYQIFRMGYYGLLTPQTAVAKSAADAEWAAGWHYIQDLMTPYALWLGLIFVLIAAAVCLSGKTVPAIKGLSGFGSVAWRSRTAVIVLIVACALIHLLYVTRVGGDFMHGRMLLLPLFALLLPVSVLPLADLRASNKPKEIIFSGALLGLGIWGVVVAAQGTTFVPPSSDSQLDIVDEREFWTYATDRVGGTPPRTAEDFLSANTMAGYKEQLHKAIDEKAALLTVTYPASSAPKSTWVPVPRGKGTEAGVGEDLAEAPLTVYLINLGMTSMNAPLDVRVLDIVGLSSPLAARGPRLEDGRIGHDKLMPFAWQAADSGADLRQLPQPSDPQSAAMARRALRGDDFVELYESYRAPLTFDRFLSNIGFAWTKGRELSFRADPQSYAESEIPSDPAVSQPQIQWPVDARSDD